MNPEKKYFAKVMLAGEYGVIIGGDALTIPLKRFYTQAGAIDQAPDEQRAFKSVEYLRNLLYYIRSLPVNSFHAHRLIQPFEEMIKTGYYLESNIPLGYGIGSSGSVSAFIYDQFFEGKETLSLGKMKQDLATIESFFHGKSSGVDALTCFLGEPLHFSGNGEIKTTRFNPAKVPGNYRFFLLDSGIVLETGPLVKWFMEALKNPTFRERMEKEYMDLNHKFIEILLEKRTGDPGLLLRAISEFQFRYFQKMIPGDMAEIWLAGQLNNTYYMKLNGAGGGYMLGITYHGAIPEVEEMLGKEKLVWI